MTRICDLNELEPGLPVALTIGVFDGVHRGHQALINQVIQRARSFGGLSVVLTFFPHPQDVLRPEAPVDALTDLQERLNLMAALGVDVVATLQFTLDLSHLSAEAFLDLLSEHMNLRELWVGPDFALGYRRSGTITRLAEIGQQRGFTVHTITPVNIANKPVSSSRIRELVAAGDVEQAAALLGRPPSLEGLVVAGVKRGRTLGFPTANLALSARYLLPANGIYAAFADVNDHLLPAVVNIGVRPTFGDNDRLVEVYILDFDRDIYNQRLRIHLVKRLRDELRFATVEALVAQMHKDVAEARAVLAAIQAR